MCTCYQRYESIMSCVSSDDLKQMDFSNYKINRLVLLLYLSNVLLRSIMKKYKHSIAKKYGFFWVTLILFSGSILGQWYFGFVTSQSWQDNLRDTFENWQSEFLQLMWQVAGLTFLWYVGSPQSKEEEERNNEMLQWLVRKVDPQNAEKFLSEIDNKYPKK
jgi:Domain of unknown function (DUF6766)